MGRSPVWYGNLFFAGNSNAAEELPSRAPTSLLQHSHLRIIAWPLTLMTSREALKRTVVAELTRAVMAQVPGATGTTK